LRFILIYLDNNTFIIIIGNSSLILEQAKNITGAIDYQNTFDRDSDITIENNNIKNIRPTIPKINNNNRFLDIDTILLEQTRAIIRDTIHGAKDQSPSRLNLKEETSNFIRRVIKIT
jgi:hypothetical protein